jgi:hypothetical protein
MDVCIDESGQITCRKRDNRKSLNEIGSVTYNDEFHFHHIFMMKLRNLKKHHQLALQIKKYEICSRKYENFFRNDCIQLIDDSKCFNLRIPKHRLRMYGLRTNERQVL